MAGTFDPTPGINRRSTETALERLSLASGFLTSNSRWYEPGKDYFFYSSAEKALRATEERLKTLKLSRDERRTLEMTNSLAMVLERMKSTQEQHDVAHKDSTLMKQLSRFTNGFSSFAVRVSGVVNIFILRSPGYSITYGLIMIVFEAVVAKKEKQQALADFVDSIVSRLPLVEFYESVFPTNAMKMIVSDLYVEIISFLEEACRYYCTGRVAKFLDVVFKPIEDKFDGYIERIDEGTKRIQELKDVAHVAQTIDMKDILDNAGHVLARLYVNFEEAVSEIGTSVMLLNHRVETLQSHQDYITTFQAKLYVQTMRQEIYPNLSDVDEEFKRIASLGFRLSPKDHWEFNGVLPIFKQWSDAGRNTALWVGGSSGNQDNWVTEMSVDLVKALDSQEKTIGVVFCDRSTRDTTSPITPRSLVERLIVQVLEAHPLLAFHNPERLNARRLRKAESFDQLWSIWEMLMDQLKEVFVVIDRIDQCVATATTTVGGVLLPRFIEMASSIPQLSVVITSNRAPPSDLLVNDKVFFFWRDTAISAHRRYDKR